jgi:hypothetical protein
VYYQALNWSIPENKSKDLRRESLCSIRIVLQIDSNVSEEHAASILRAEISNMAMQLVYSIIGV